MFWNCEKCCTKCSWICLVTGALAFVIGACVAVFVISQIVGLVIK